MAGAQRKQEEETWEEEWSLGEKVDGLLDSNGGHGRARGRPEKKKKKKKKEERRKAETSENE